MRYYYEPHGDGPCGNIDTDIRHGETNKPAGIIVAVNADVDWSPSLADIDRRLRAHGERPTKDNIVRCTYGDARWALGDEHLKALRAVAAERKVARDSDCAVMDRLYI